MKTLHVKNYVLDTNVLLHDPNSLLNFQKNNVLIPIEVIEEIDHFKRESTELGQNAGRIGNLTITSEILAAILNDRGESSATVPD